VFKSHLGEIAALLTAFFWTITAVNFETAAKRVGSLSVNFLRLVIAFLFLGFFRLFTESNFLPWEASGHAWLWLSLSGLIGFVIGDYCLFQAYVEVGARIAMLIMALVPPLTAIIGWCFLDEKLTWWQILAMVITVTGVASVVFEKNSGQDGIKLTRPLKGILLALGGAIGQAVGLILSKYGMGQENAFLATQIRVITGIVGFALILLLSGRIKTLKKAIGDRVALRKIGLGAFFGPFLGVTGSLYAVQHALAGVASTIMAIVPVLIIPFSIIILKERVRLKEIIGAFWAIIGIALFFL